jgi:hypothetical protein
VPVLEANDTSKSSQTKHLREQNHLNLNFESLKAIAEAIERLNHMAVAIRQSTVTSHTTKARKFAETFDFTTFGGLAYLVLKSLYPVASEKFLELLTKSMIETYALYLHRESRQKLKVPRPRLQKPVPLNTIPEGSAVDYNGSNNTDSGSQLLQQGIGTTATMLRPLPSARPKLSSEPTSVDSQAVRIRINKRDNSEAKSTTSILVNQADYPKPTKGSNVCDWCFSPLPSGLLEGDKWQ